MSPGMCEALNYLFIVIYLYWVKPITKVFLLGAQIKKKKTYIKNKYVN